jgi:hypothetical protein
MPSAVGLHIELARKVAKTAAISMDSPEMLYRHRQPALGRQVENHRRQEEFRWVAQGFGPPQAWREANLISSPSNRAM